MIKSVLLFFATLTTVGMFSTAHADVAGPVARCSVKAENMKGMTLGVLLSVGGLETASATITCKEPGKKAVSKKAAVVISGIGAGVGISVYKNFRLESVMVGVTDPNDIFGDYNIGVKAGVNLFDVEGGFIATAGLDNGVSMKLGLYGAKAYGLAAHAQAIYMEVMTPADYKKLLEKRKEQQQGGSNK
jgi:hypothetical protein